jgi:hypothetical protein
MPMSMSAADWTRMQRRKAGSQYMTEASKAVNPTAAARNPYGEALLIPTEVGRSRIRRTASDYTNYVASNLADYVLKSQGTGRAGENGTNTGAAKLTVNMINRGTGCACSTTLGITLPKTGTCSKCAVTQHVRIN